MDLLSVLFSVFGGLAVFLFGLRYLSDALKRIAGNRLKKLIEKLTSNRLGACGIGTLTTAVIQSSSMTMVTLIGFLNAGLIGLEQAVWVMLGAEIGTTITAQIVAFKLGALFLPIIAIGFFLSFFSKNWKLKGLGNILFGFGLLFMGMHLMSSGVKPLAKEPFAQEILASFGQTPFLGVVAGAVFTAIIQSSSATTGLVIAMGSAGIIGLPAAIALAFGANIGTTITGLLASIGSRISSKRLAVAQAVVNIIGVALFFPFIYQFAGFIALTSTELPRQIANAHSAFNLIVTALMLPLSGVLVWISKKAVRGFEPKIEHGMKYVNKNIMIVPAIAVAQIEKEVQRMAKIALEMLSLSRKALLEGDLKKTAYLPEKEDTLDELKFSLFFLLEELNKREISERDRREIAILKGHVIDIERVGDHANNLFELAQRMSKSRVEFDRNQRRELKEYFSNAIEGFRAGVKAIETRNQKYFSIVLEKEKKLDNLQEKTEYREVKEKGDGAGACLLEAAINLERVSDHAKNIVQIIKQGF